MRLGVFLLVFKEAKSGMLGGGGLGLVFRELAINNRPSLSQQDEI